MMKVEAVTLREIQMPLVHPFETSFEKTTHRRILLVTVHCEGVDGWGECVAGEGPFYLEEWIDGAWSVSKQFLVPAILGKTLSAGSDFPALVSKIRGNRMAKAGIENSLWDAEAKAKQVPLWKLLGGTRKEIVCGVSIGIQESPEKLLEKIETELAAGYQRIKIKVKPGWDVNVLEKIRARWPSILLSVDANSAYTLDDFAHLKSFDQFKLLMIEQPLFNDDFYFHAKLQSQIETSICLDESIRQARDAEVAIDAGACRIINVKVGRVGGFSEAIKVHDAAQKRGVPVWCGGMLESGIGRVQNIALSTLANFSLPGDVSASARYWHEDIVEPEVCVSPQGRIAVSDAQDMGYRVRQDFIEKLTVRKETLR